MTTRLWVPVAGDVQLDLGTVQVVTEGPHGPGRDSQPATEGATASQ